MIQINYFDRYFIGHLDYNYKLKKPFFGDGKAFEISNG